MVGAASVVMDGRNEAIVLAACLALLVVALPAPTRNLALVGLAGLGVGFAVASVHGAGDQSRAAPVLAESTTGVLISDPRLGSRGGTALFEWPDANAGSVESLVIYSGIEAIGRGDLIAVTGSWLDSSGTLLFADRIEVVEPAGRVELRRRAMRQTARDRVLSRVPGSNGSLALGLLIGDDSGLSETERERLRASGLSHITAVSGSNVALVIAAVAFLLRALNKVGWTWFGIQIAGVLFYLWIVGADPPIVRAAIMGSLILLAGLIGRPTHLFTLLALAGAAMCIHDPGVLNSLGFQLSFLSMIGLGLAGDVISRARGTRRKVATALLSPAGAALLTAPLLAARFGTFSPGTIPANMLVAPVIAPATMLSGGVALIPDGFVSGELLGGIVWLLTGLILATSDLVGGSELAVVTFAPLSNAQTVGLYLLIGVALAPLIPEVRGVAHRIRLWAVGDPPRATVVAGVCALALAAFTVLID